MLSDKAVQDYKVIYKRKFGEELTDQEARKQAEGVMGLFKKIINHKMSKDATTVKKSS